MATILQDTETGQITGTKDKDYNIIWFVEQCLSNALRLEIYIKDAEREDDSELADFFRRAQSESRKGAEKGKKMLATLAHQLDALRRRPYRGRPPLARRSRAIARAIRRELRRIAGSWPESGSQ